MSLINDALKKAQRLRTEDQPGATPPAPGGGVRVEKRAQPRTAQQLVLIASAVVVLVVLTVVATVWLVNRPSSTPPVSTVATAPAVKPPGANTPAPVIVAPLVKPAPASPPVAAAPTPERPLSATPGATPPAPAPDAVPPATTPVVVQAAPTPTASALPSNLADAPAVAATEPPPAAPAPTGAPPKDDERIHVFVDAIHVMGIRSSGDDSRVLMNDRVFRLNDIVDRTLGLRLTKVAPNTLTFTDGNGATYVKNF